MKISKERAKELGMPLTAWDGITEIEVKNVHVSEEFLQDMHILQKETYRSRTPPITVEELEEWKEAAKRLDAVDYKDALKRVVFIAGTGDWEPYEDYEAAYNKYLVNTIISPRWEKREKPYEPPDYDEVMKRWLELREELKDDIEKWKREAEEENDN
jgi:hypothetical protein